jgi:hypothetical protein
MFVPAVCVVAAEHRIEPQPVGISLKVSVGISPEQQSGAPQATRFLWAGLGPSKPNTTDRPKAIHFQIPPFADKPAPDPATPEKPGI